MHKLAIIEPGPNHRGAIGVGIAPGIGQVEQLVHGKAGIQYHLQQAALTLEVHRWHAGNRLAFTCVRNVQQLSGFFRDKKSRAVGKLGN